jgi:hypothetical protein
MIDRNDMIQLEPAEEFDAAIIGTIEIAEDLYALAYSLSKILEIYMRDRMTEDDAFEFFDYNASYIFLSASDSRRQGASAQHPVLIFDTYSETTKTEKDDKTSASSNTDTE